MRNHLKKARTYTYNRFDSVRHFKDSRQVTAQLIDPDEPDRRIYLNLSAEQATALAHRLLFHVACLEDS
jgi:hypothetical protein